MNFRRIKTVADVVSWRLCMGCGACVSACPENAVRLIDIKEQGLRPEVISTSCQNCGQCIKVCPGIELSHRPFDNQTISELCPSWGPILEVWEGYATDPEIRHQGSSGGVATALALYCLENEKIDGALHVGTMPDSPLQNVSVFSKTREDLLACAGSRYAPAAACEKLDLIEQARSSCVFIGKPCDVAALRKTQVVNQELAKKIGLAISIFCAGTPSSSGTDKVLETLGVKADEIAQFRYRGFGWPGNTVAKVKGGDTKKYEMTYKESWGSILCNHVPLRCRLCPDSTGEFADISCGDPWYRDIDPDDDGRSLVLVRTELGKKLLHMAIKAGYIQLKKSDPAVLDASQKALLNKRRSLFGRILAMRMLLIPAPSYRGFSLWANWLQLSWRDKLRSVFGTIRRIITRGWLSPVKPIKTDAVKCNKTPQQVDSIV